MTPDERQAQYLWEVYVESEHYGDIKRTIKRTVVANSAIDVINVVYDVIVSMERKEQIDILAFPGA